MPRQQVRFAQARDQQNRAGQFRAGQVRAGLAPALALTVQQIVHASRSHPAPSTSNRLDAATDKEDDAP